MKKIFVILTVFVLFASFSIPAFSHEYGDDDTLNPFKLAAYAVYPAGFVLENVIVKPLHWFSHLPLIRNISGHDKISDEGMWSDLELTREIEEIKKNNRQ